MKNLLTIAFILIFGNVLSQTLIAKSQLHRSLKIMSRPNYDSEKVNKKLSKINLGQGEKPLAKRFFLEKAKYGNLYNNEFRELCSFYLDSNFTDGVINKNTDPVLIRDYLKLNESLLNYFIANPRECRKIQKKYSITINDIKCVQRYLGDLLNSSMKDPVLSTTNSIDSLNSLQKFEKFQENIIITVKSLKPSTSIQTEGYFYSKNDTIVVGFSFFHNDKGGFITNEYNLNNSTVIEDFCDSILEVNGNVLRSEYLIYAAVRGESDGQKFKSNTYNENHILKEIKNLKYVELHPRTEEIINEGILNLKNGDPITSNLILAVVRAYYAKEKFQTKLNYPFNSIEAIDHYKADDREKRVENRYRKIAFFLVFTDKSYSEIGNFFFHYKNFKPFDIINGTPSINALKRIMGEKNYQSLHQKK
jgi:hypothetical protein